MNLNLEKGNKLERAIGVIESLVLESNPNLKNKPFIIEPKKIVIIDGVRHEIDLYIEIDLGSGYKSIYLFECKNWDESINKNDIIVFSEKISVTQATKGYFVAKKFSRYAIAQAKKDSRIRLLKANEALSKLTSLNIKGFSVAHATLQKLSVSFDREERREKVSDVIFVELNGEKIEISNFTNSLGNRILNEAIDSLSVLDIFDNKHSREAERLFIFDSGSLLIDGKEVTEVLVKIEFEFLVKKLAIRANFDVETRGRIFEFDKVDLQSQKSQDSSFVYYNDGKITFLL